MKKNIIAALVIVFIGAGLVFGYFFAADKFDPPASPQPQIFSAIQEKSFQGMLADSFREIGKISSAATERMLNPVPDVFTDKNSAQKQKENFKAEKSTLRKSPGFSFAIIGDTQNFNIENQNGYFQQAMDSIQKTKSAFVIAIGDLLGKCSGGKSCQRDYEYWKNITEKIAPKIYAVQGNHDRIGGTKADEAWQMEFDFPKNGPPKFSEITYSFDFKNTHFVVLASDNPEMHLVNLEQRAWLEKDLAENIKENIFVFFHEPAFPVYEIAGESLDNRPGERDALWKILDRHNVTAVFSGHEHLVSRRLINSGIFPPAKNSIYQFGFGSTDSFDHKLPSASVAEYANQGQGRFGLVRVNGKEITVETHGPDGALLNTFTFSK